MGREVEEVRRRSGDAGLGEERLTKSGWDVRDMLLGELEGGVKAEAEGRLASCKAARLKAESPNDSCSREPEGLAALSDGRGILRREGFGEVAGMVSVREAGRSLLLFGLFPDAGSSGEAEVKISRSGT